MNKRIRKKKWKRRRDLSRERILLLKDDDISYTKAVFKHYLEFNDIEFLRNNIMDTKRYVVMPRYIGKQLVLNFCEDLFKITRSELKVVDRRNNK